MLKITMQGVILTVKGFISGKDCEGAVNCLTSNFHFVIHSYFSKEMDGGVNRSNK